MTTSEQLSRERDEMISEFEDTTQELQANADYYNAESRPHAIGVSVPIPMRKLLAQVGYPRLYVNALSDRLEVEGFRTDTEAEGDRMLWDWWTANRLDVQSVLAHTDALVNGRSYITVSTPTEDDLNIDPDVPIIRVEPATSLYAEKDPRTHEIVRAIRVSYTEKGGEVAGATMYTPESTYTWIVDKSGWSSPRVINHGLGIVPVVPLENTTLLSDRYGSSEITPELRSVTDAASRIMMNMQATAELMAVPQRLLFGVKPEELGVDPSTGQVLFDSYLARIMAFEDEGAKATQFQAAELINFSHALTELAKQAAAYTGLPPQYLSTDSDNPASAEAIKASESRLVKNAERKTKVFGGAWEQAMRVAYKAMNGGDVPTEYFRMETVWRDPSTPTYAAKADAATKLFGAGQGVIPRERARIDMGYTIVERAEMKAWDEEDASLLANTILAGTYAGTNNGDDSKEAE